VLDLVAVLELVESGSEARSTISARSPACSAM
jgi:hypothetical protein